MTGPKALLAACVLGTCWVLAQALDALAHGGSLVGGAVVIACCLFVLDRQQTVWRELRAAS